MTARCFPGLFASGNASNRKRVSGQKGKLFRRSFKCMFIVCIVAAGPGEKLIDDKVPGIGQARLSQLTRAIQTFVWFIHQIFPGSTGWPATSPSGAECPAPGRLVK
jgi:hypothetical protein